MLRVVLPDVLALGDLRQNLATIDLGGVGQDRVESGFDGFDSVAGEEFGQPTRAHEAGRAFGVEVGRERVGHPRVSGHDPQRRLVRLALGPEFDRRDHEALFEDARRTGWHRSRAGAADVVVVAKSLYEAHDSAFGENGHGHAHVRKVADSTFGFVDVVVEEDIAFAHLLDGEVADDGVDQRGVRTSGEFAQLTVVDSRTEVVGVANHR